MAAHSLGLLVPKPDRLVVRWIDDLRFFQVVCRMDLDHSLACIAFLRGQVVQWSCVDLQDPLYLNHWHRWRMADLADKRVPQHERGADRQFLYFKHRLPSIAVHFMAEDHWSRHDDGVAVV